MNLADKLREIQGTHICIKVDNQKSDWLKESYSGYIKDVGDDYVEIDCSAWTKSDVVINLKYVVGYYPYEKSTVVTSESKKSESFKGSKKYNSYYNKYKN